MTDPLCTERMRRAVPERRRYYRGRTAEVQTESGRGCEQTEYRMSNTECPISKEDKDNIEYRTPNVQYRRTDYPHVFPFDIGHSVLDIRYFFSSFGVGHSVFDI